jgi:P pilus assembly chaperone PapD
LLLVACAVCGAFVIEPSLIIFFTDKGERSTFVDVVHTKGDPAAIQLSVRERVLNLDGVLVKEKLPVSSDFLVHPAQVILYPNERATVQIQYKGKSKIVADKAYVLYSQEVPIDVGRDEGGVHTEVKMLTNYYTVISLDTGKPGKLVFVSSKAIEGGKVEVIAENRSAGRVNKDRLNLTVGGKQITVFTGGANSIMPGQQRRFTFEWPRAVTEKEVRFGY